MTRLSDERLAEIIGANATAFVEPEGLAMALEIQERRKADLDAVEVGWLRDLRVDMTLEGADDEALAVVDKLLSAHGVKL